MEVSNVDIFVECIEWMGCCSGSCNVKLVLTSEESLILLDGSTSHCAEMVFCMGCDPLSFCWIGVSEVIDIPSLVMIAIRA